MIIAIIKIMHLRVFPRYSKISKDKVDQLCSYIDKYLCVDQCLEMAQESSENGRRTNFWGRILWNNHVTEDNVVLNNYVQSTAVDVALSGFSKVYSKLDCISTLGTKFDAANISSFSKLSENLQKIPDIRLNQKIDNINKYYSNIVNNCCVFYFLIAYWLYMDGIDTVVRMALAFGADIGLATSELIVALIITQFVGFPATIGFGFLADRYGLKLLLYVGIGMYICICFGGLVISSIYGFYIMAAIIGLVQGGVQSVSRAVFSTMIPEGKDSEFFGFYNLVGKSAVIFGPAMVGIVNYLFNDPRAGIISLLILFIPGLLMLRMVQIKEQ